MNKSEALFTLYRIAFRADRKAIRSFSNTYPISDPLLSCRGGGWGVVRLIMVWFFASQS